MNKIILLLTFISLLTISSIYLFQNSQSYEQEIQNNNQQEESVCPFQEPEYRSSEKHFDTLKKMKNEHMADKKLQVLKQEVPLDPKVLNGIQVDGYLDDITFLSYKIQAINFLKPYIEALSTEEILQILENVTFVNEKLETLEALKSTIFDGTEENKQKIVESFVFNDKMKKAKEILEDVTPFQTDCIFGSVKEKFATFVIDVSGSMDQTFVQTDGSTITRLNAVKQHLSEVIENQLKEYQYFNVVSFQSTASKWKNQNVAATKENIKDAMKFINSLRANGGTDIDRAFHTAFSTSSDLEAIYFLGDGYGNLNSNTIPNHQKNFDPKVKINTTAFMLGGGESQSSRRQAIDLLEQIARDNQGTFRQFQ